MSSKHLCYDIKSDDDLRLYIDPGVMFVDFNNAIIDSHLLKNVTSFEHLSRGGTSNGSSKYYNFGIKALVKSLTAGKHRRVQTISLLVSMLQL